MIRPLRIGHRRIFTLLGVLLPVAFGLGIAARKPAPQMDAVPAGLQSESKSFMTTVWERADLFTNAPVRVRLLRDGQRLAIACAATADFAKPDLLVYWSGRAAPVADMLPDDAVLLGAFEARNLPLPAGATTGEGALILFSLADQEVVAVSKPVRFNAPAP